MKEYERIGVTFKASESTGRLFMTATSAILLHLAHHSRPKMTRLAGVAGNGENELEPALCGCSHFISYFVKSYSLLGSGSRCSLIAHAQSSGRL